MYNINIIQTFADRYPRWKQSVDLSGVRYGLYFDWSTRMESWFMSVLNMNDEVLLGGIRLVPVIDLLEKYRASVPALPPGILRVLDKESDTVTAEITRDNLGVRFLLSYTETEED
jgi:hypothetical protein